MLPVSKDAVLESQEQAEPEPLLPSVLSPTGKPNIGPPNDQQQDLAVFIQDAAAREIIDDEIVHNDAIDSETIEQDPEPTSEATEQKEVQEEAQKDMANDAVALNDVSLPDNTIASAWHSQERYVSQDVYADPHAAAQEYVDYGRNYYASAQKSLDPSPVLQEVHETPDAVEDPVVSEITVFVGDEDMHTGHSTLSLHKELEELHGEEHDQGMEEETGIPSSPNTFHEVDKDIVPEAENAATMHGQDDLFDDDSEESAGSIDSSDSANPEELVGQDQDTSQEYELVHESLPHQGHDNRLFKQLDEEPYEVSQDTEVLQTPTTIVGDSHSVNTVTSPEYERPVTPDASTPRASYFKGLANSRHAPKQQQQQQYEPVTPPRQTAVHNDKGFDGIDFLPRDVTHVPWQKRDGSIDVTPGSVRSQATLSTSASSSFGTPSPWSAGTVTTMTPGTSAIISGNSVPQDDPFIRASWSSSPEGGHGSGYSQGDDHDIIPSRGKSIGQLNYSYNGQTVNDPEMKDLVLAVSQTPQSNNSRPSSVVATSSPTSLFQRMRNIFEPPQNGTAQGTPVKPTTPAASSSDAFPAIGNATNRPVDRDFRRGTQATDSRQLADDAGVDDLDADDLFNEKSSLLQASAIDMPLH
ncbi:hypothetical protein SPBR_02550 [Sporothrix brasiliensis 5110]|uniref:Uncharacterized protein n=1 Tax=Sporothrix brasiliensis 5110 TaxID=1398154 RepID=A0A0C2IU85_9PEZI|nr:uncharacterized protein SPBR_02550 [Sporothrix brasiliensis 5110]KIH92671.1 hypothetical protein SPBR_02550 [Sporothrix brasiliensis 5110]